MELVLEVVAGPAGTNPERVTALDYEALDDAMKDDAGVVRRLVLLVRLRMLPLFRALDQTDEVGDGLGGFAVEELNRKIPERRLKVRVGSHRPILWASTA